MKVTGHDASVTSLPAAQAKEAQQAKEAEPTRAAERSASGLDSSAVAGAAASVSFSDKVEEVQEIARAAKAEPEVRQDAVEKAKLDLQAGQLQADPNELAALIARDLF